VQRLFGTVTGKRVAILGFAFKADTNDTREAPAIRIALDLLEEGAQLAIHDPKVEQAQIARDLREEPVELDPATGKSQGLSGVGSWLSFSSVEEAVEGADAVVLLTEWSQYKSLDWQDLSRRMRRPAWVFDSRTIVNPDQVRSAGLRLWCVGNGSL
jgi:UDPglucose 6-dehydrogenase